MPHRNQIRLFVAFLLLLVVPPLRSDAPRVYRTELPRLLTPLVHQVALEEFVRLLEGLVPAVGKRPDDLPPPQGDRVAL